MREEGLAATAWEVEAARRQEIVASDFRAGRSSGAFAALRKALGMPRVIDDVKRIDVAAGLTFDVSDARPRELAARACMPAQDRLARPSRQPIR